MPKTCRKLKKLILLSLSLLALIVRTGDARGDAGDATQESVSICIGGAPGIPPLLAHDQRLFSSAGVEVNLKKYRNSAEAFENFHHGACDLSSTNETLVVMSSFERNDFSILATYMTSDNSSLVLASRKSGIGKVQDLRGKRIHVYRGSSNHFFLDMFLNANGLTARDVNMIFTGFSDVSGAFAEGAIDAFCASEVLIDKPKKTMGKDALLFGSPGLVLTTYHLAAKKSFIKARPDLIRKVLAALLKNEDSIRKNHDAAVKTAAASLGIDEQTMGGIWDKYNWAVCLKQTLLLSLEQEAGWAMDSGFTNKTRIPNYLDFVHQDALLALKPEAVTILQ